jgi:hypothetical protein
MIDDVFACQTALPPGTQGDYLMGGYNSNGMFPAYHQAVCPPPAQQGFMNLAYRTPTNNLPPNQSLLIPEIYQTPYPSQLGDAATSHCD